MSTEMCDRQKSGNDKNETKQDRFKWSSQPIIET